MWKKKGLLFDVSSFKKRGLHSHGSIPFAYHLREDLFRIFFSSRDEWGRSQPYYYDALINDGEIKLVGDVVGPIFDFGPKGTFDDNGIMPSCIIDMGDEVWMYYIGWNPQVTVSYRLSIGLAISKDGGNTFFRSSDGPLLDRSYLEPYFNTAPYVIKDGELYRMVYVSCTGWIEHLGRMEPRYLLRQSFSADGITWTKPGDLVLGYSQDFENLGRPCLLKSEYGYKLFFSHRMSMNYREDPEQSYKIGVLESKDALTWENLKIDIFREMPMNWDKNMYEYCHVFTHNQFTYMLYNGNDHGAQGFGYAVALNSI
jgi:hypothetical protein